jgi:Na+/H+ antiporter NhaA
VVAPDRTYEQDSTGAEGRSAHLPQPQPPESAGRTLWSRRDTPLRHVLSTEAGGGVFLLGAAVAALVWANIDLFSYTRVWSTELSVRLGHFVLSMDLRTWVNSGLMSFFFLVVGLEARREIDIGEFRERTRAVLPVLAGVGGMTAAIGLYLAINAGRPSAQGWGVAMSTDTAFALGLLALLGHRVPERLRAFVLTVTVVDDIVGVIVIATAYTRSVDVVPLLVAAGLFAAVLVAVRLHVTYGLVYLALGVAAWVAMSKSGVDPVVVGLGAGLVAYAAPVARPDLERASSLFIEFREQPTPELARSARAGLRTVLSPNVRLEQLYLPWTSYLIVPLFGLANAGIPVDANLLSRAYTSPITLGIFVGYAVGKPFGVTFISAVVPRLTHGRLRPPVGWASVLCGGTLAGIGFTVPLLIAALAFGGPHLEEAKIGVLTAGVWSAVATWLVVLVTSRLPKPLRARALLGRSEVIVDLAEPVDNHRDHIRGPAGAPVTLVEYGDFECPYCGQAEPVVRELLAGFGDLRYVWRHLPLSDVHPRAQLAAEASEAAAAQGAFWPMHDILLDHQAKLGPEDLVRFAGQLGLDVERFTRELRAHTWRDRVAADVESADLSGVAGTPSFFLNGQRHAGAYDIDTLSRSVRTARARAALRTPQPEPARQPAGGP